LGGSSDEVKLEQIGNALSKTIDKSLDVAVTAFESLFVLTPEQKDQGEKATRSRQAEADDSHALSRYVAEIAADRRQQEQERNAARQRDRERDRDR
jgi:hypothetical protein